MWKEYAYAQNIHPAIMSYLNIRPQYFCTVETTVDGKRFATPRGWEDLSQLIQVYETLGKKTDRDVVVFTASQDRKGFCKLSGTLL